MSKKKYSIQITDAKRQTDIANQSEYIDVSFDILDGKKVVESRRLAFPLGATEKEITAELKKVSELYASEKKTEKERREEDQKNTKANENIAALVGKKI